LGVFILIAESVERISDPVLRTPLLPAQCARGVGGEVRTGSRRC
jgi:hypothetical protein